MAQIQYLAGEIPYAMSVATKRKKERKKERERKGEREKRKEGRKKGNSHLDGTDGGRNGKR